MKNKKLLTLLSLAVLTSCNNVESSNISDGIERIASSSLDASTSYISLEKYKDKVKGGIVGSMAGVAYGFPKEFKSKNWIGESELPVWNEEMVQNGYDQDDIYLTITAIEALKELGIDVNSSELGIYMYNKDFEFWNGSNNDVLKRGFKPPFSGYPKYSTSYLTGAYPDGNSYQCGASFAGYIGLDMQKVINDNCQKFAEICCYGDVIYAMQYISTMYGKAFFTDDIREIINAGLKAIPSDSWSALVINDVLKNYDNNMSAMENFKYLQRTYINSDEYNWIGWPYNGILLDAKMCSAFTTIGLLYGNKDMEKSMKITVQCANDSDSTCAATAGILSVINGFSNMPSTYKNKIIENQMFKYSRSTIDTAVNNCEDLVKEFIIKNGGKIAYVDDELSIVIPSSSKVATIEKYKNSKYPEKMDLMSYSDEEIDMFRTISDPGFERSVSSLTNGWISNKKSNSEIEWMKQTAYEGLCNLKINASKDEKVNVYTTVSCKENTNYTLECVVKTSDAFNSKIGLFVNNSSSLTLREKVFDVGSSWTKITLTVNTGNNSTLQIGAFLNGANDTDFVRIDNFTFQKK